MNHTEQRKKLRALLAGTKCSLGANVFDPLSARVAEAVGYEIGYLPGSVAAATIVGAPDLVVLTLTELAEQIRRMMRVSNLSLVVDADHGYGNALNVMRTVQELEHAGVSALTIEDTALPIAFGQVLVGEKFGHAVSGDRMISLEEGVGKMRAAVAARSDPSLVIVARTSALKIEGLESALARFKAYAAAGVDAIFINSQLEKIEQYPEVRAQVQAIHAATKVPIMFPSLLLDLKLDDLAACGVRLLQQSAMQSVAGAVKTLREIYTHLFSGGAPMALKSKTASPPEMDQLVNGDNYKRWMGEYLR